MDRQDEIQHKRVRHGKWTDETVARQGIYGDEIKKQRIAEKRLRAKGVEDYIKSEGIANEQKESVI